MKKKKVYYVYIVKCKYGTYYTGYTDDIEKRVKAHNEGKGAKYLRGRGPVKLVHQEKHKSKNEAMRAECTIKSMTKQQKESLINKRCIKT